MNTTPRIFTVASWKGGVGKTTLAYEVAYQLGAILVDLDWDRGSSTKAWGYRTELRKRSQLLSALTNGTTPRWISGQNTKPDLLPGHEDFALEQPDSDTMANMLEKWAAEWERDLVIDTHPGGATPSTLGAMAASERIIVPAVLEEKPMEGLEQMLEQVPDYPLLIIPHMIEGAPPAKYIDRLKVTTRRAEVSVGPPIRRYKWIQRRGLRRAIASDPIPKRAEDYVLEVAAVVEEISK